jgi:hypothetical protein
MNKEKTERRVLVNKNQVHADSLPWSLRHCTPGDALFDARQIACFLREFAFNLAINPDYGDDQDAFMGMMYTCNLLLDKIEIGRGAYKFPTVGYGEDLSAMAERVEV